MATARSQQLKGEQTDAAHHHLTPRAPQAAAHAPRQPTGRAKGPVLCTHCGKCLTAAGGYGGHYYFLLVQDAQGNRGKVHGDCWGPLDHSKWTLVPKPTTKGS